MFCSNDFTLFVFHRSKIFCGLYVGYNSFQSKYNIYNVYDYMIRIYTYIYIYSIYIYINICICVNVYIYIYT